MFASATGTSMSEVVSAALGEYLGRARIRWAFGKAQGNPSLLRDLLKEKGVAVKERPLQIRGRKRGSSASRTAPTHSSEGIPLRLMEAVEREGEEISAKFKKIWPVYLERALTVGQIDPDSPHLLPEADAWEIAYEILYKMSPAIAERVYEHFENSES